MIDYFILRLYNPRSLITWWCGLIASVILGSTYGLAQERRSLNCRIINDIETLSFLTCAFPKYWPTELILFCFFIPPPPSLTPLPQIIILSLTRTTQLTEFLRLENRAVVSCKMDLIIYNPHYHYITPIRFKSKVRLRDHWKRAPCFKIAVLEKGLKNVHFTLIAVMLVCFQEEWHVEIQGTVTINCDLYMAILKGTCF